MYSTLAPTDPAIVEDDLPVWMRPHRRRIDWGALFIGTVGLVLTWPLALWAGLPSDTDAALFVARSEQVATALRSGALYTRWAADFNFGFGSPLFNYLAPLPHNLTGYHQLITDADPVDSVKLALALSILVAGLGMYYLIEWHYGMLGGVIGALTYLGSIPVAYALPLQSGDLAAVLSLALLPWTLWALERLMAKPRRSALLGAVASLTLWSLADTRLTLVTIPLFGVIVIRGVADAPNRRSALMALLLALGFAGLLTAFFWLPALAENTAVVWVSVDADPRGGPIPLTDSLIALPPVMVGNQNTSLALGLGPGVTLAAGVGAVVIGLGRIRAHHPLRWQVVAFGVLGMASVLLATPLFATWWAYSNGWQSIRPYDLLIGLALPGWSFLAAQVGRIPALHPFPFLDRGSTEIFFRRRTRIGVVALYSLIPLLGTLSALSTPPWIPDPALSTAPATIETDIHAVATLRYGLLLPASVFGSTAALTTFGLAGAYANSVKLPSDVLLVERAPLSSRYTVSPPSSGENVSLDRIKFPGWWLTIDGETYTSSADSLGRIALNVPGTAHEIMIGFGSTPPRILGWLLTGFGALILAGRLLGLRGTVDIP